MEKAHCTAIVLAGGRGRRMGTAQSKMYLLIQDKPVLYYSLDVFEKSSVIDEVILVTGKGQIPSCRQTFVEEDGFLTIKTGGEGGAVR